MSKKQVVRIVIYGDFSKKQPRDKGNYKIAKLGYSLWLPPEGPIRTAMMFVQRSFMAHDTNLIKRGAVEHRALIKQQKIEPLPFPCQYSPKPLIVEYIPTNCIFNNRLELISELYIGALLKKNTNLTVTQALEQFAIIADTLQTLHDNGKIHNDVKCANLLLDQAGKFYLHDFDLTHDYFNNTSDPNQPDKATYYCWDHAREEGIITPNTDVFGLVLSIAMLFFSGFQRHINLNAKNFKQVLKEKLSSLTTFYATCTSKADKDTLLLISMWRSANKTDAEIEELLAGSNKRFQTLQILKRELTKSEKLLEALQKQARPFQSIIEWQRIVEELNLTSARALAEELRKIGGSR